MARTNTTSDLQLERLQHFKLPTGALGGCWAMDEKWLVAACIDGVYAGPLEDAALEKVGQHDSYVSSVAYLAASDEIVSAGYDGVVKWTERASRTTKRSLTVHAFWSWDLALSSDQSMLASVTGQYLAGGYRYEPQPEREPSLKLVDARTGELRHALEHVPSVQAVAFSHDSRLVAAGNLMGEVRVWDCQSGERVAEWTTPAFTSWGIIKSHCYLGGIFAMRFSSDGDEILLAGMGPMRDPMAGNGRQLWQKWKWSQEPPELVDETHDGESGEGLMEALAIHPSGTCFAMGGRLRGGDWNVGLFDMTSGARIGQLKTGYRVTEILFDGTGHRMVLVGTQGQPMPEGEGSTFADFGRVEVYSMTGIMA